MDTQLKGKVVLITGASGGIGAACAEVFAEEGARLALHANTNLEAAEQLCATLSVPSIALQADLTQPGEVAGLFQKTYEHFGAIDIVLAVAGIWPPEPLPVQQMPLERWNETIATNQTAVFLCAKEFFGVLEREKPESASFIIIGSTAAVFGEANHVEYSSSKAAVVYGMTRSLKNEITRIVPRGRVNAVCPGWVVTPMTVEDLKDTAATTKILQTRPIKRIARADDIAYATAFLASDRLAGHITGEIITVSGGMEGRLLHEKDEIDPSQA